MGRSTRSISASPSQVARTPAIKLPQARALASAALALLTTLIVPIAPAVHRVPAVAQPTDPTAGTVPTCDALWQQPVTAAVVDGFRPPDNPYGTGNRGLEYGTAPGDAVSAVAAGQVVFSGPVGGDRFVVVQHGPAYKVTYGYLTESAVAVGQALGGGDAVGLADAGFHLTVRTGPAGQAPVDGPSGRQTYIDPAPLFAATCFTVKLVPVPAGFGE